MIKFFIFQGYKEQQDLVMFDGSNQPHKRNEQQEYSTRDDAGHNTDTGDNGHCFSIRSNCDEDQGH